MSAIATIRAADLPLVLAAANMRSANQGQTCQLCAVSETHMLEFGCRDQVRYGAAAAARAASHGMSRPRVTPMKRGDICRVYERVKLERGRAEVVKTWGAGIRALMAEPLYVLNGGRT